MFTEKLFAFLNLSCPQIEMLSNEVANVLNPNTIKKVINYFYLCSSFIQSFLVSLNHKIESDIVPRLFCL